jgi:hypothetical protein
LHTTWLSHGEERMVGRGAEFKGNRGELGCECSAIGCDY